MANIEHKNITDPNIHEPKGAAGASAGAVYIADGAGSGTWTVLNTDNTLFNQQADKIVSNTTTETTLVSSGFGTVDIPSNLLRDGSQFIIRVAGIYSATGNPTLTIRVRLNSTVVLTATLSSLPSNTDKRFVAEALVTFRATGLSGSVMGSGSSAADSTSAAMISLIPVSVDTSAGVNINVTAQWSAANSGNSVNAQILTVLLV